VVLEYAHRFSSRYRTIWWIDAEHPALLGEQLIQLGRAMQLNYVDVDAERAIAELYVALTVRSDWLLVLDNIRDPTPYIELLSLPYGSILLTCHEDDWQKELMVTIQVELFESGEAVALMQRFQPSLSDLDALDLADVFDGLPLAIGQAMRFATAAGIGASQLRSLLLGYPTEVYSRGKPVAYPMPLARLTQYTMDRVSEDDTTSTLLRLIPFLAPEPIPTRVLQHGIRPVSDIGFPVEIALADSIRSLTSLGLVRIVGQAVIMHRTVQAIIRGILPEWELEHYSSLADSAVVGARPGDPDDPRFWPEWSDLAPQILARYPERSDNADLRELAVDYSWFLLDRGEVVAGRELAENLYRTWNARLGSKDLSTLSAGNRLAWGLRGEGRIDEAFEVDRSVFLGRMSILGRDHIDTLRSAGNLAADFRRLNDWQASLRVDADTTMRRVKTLGLLDLETLRSLSNLGADLREIGAHDLAVRCHVAASTGFEVLGRRLHPEYLKAKANLAADLRSADDALGALVIGTETFGLQVESLGLVHPDLERTIDGLVLDLRALDCDDEASKLTARWREDGISGFWWANLAKQ
jgi:hypothetical protein